MSLAREYEKQLIGRIISSTADYYRNADGIHIDLLTTSQPIFVAYVEAIEAKVTPSVIYLSDKCPDSKKYILGAVEGVDFSIPIADLIGVLEEDMKVRALNDSIMAATTKPTSEEKIEVLSMAMAKVHGGGRSSIVKASDVARERVAGMMNKVDDGLKTGFPYFDKLTGGFQKSDLIIIAGEPSMGKSSLALNIADVIASEDNPLLFISLEMSNNQLVDRVISCRTEINIRDFKENYPVIENAAAEFYDMDFYLADDMNVNVHYIIGLIRAACLCHGVKVVFIDYLQLMSYETSRGREQEVGFIARALKNLAKELNIPIVALSQLNRPRDNDHYPRMKRLRESGQIEEAADIIWFIYRREECDITEYNGESTEGHVEHIIAKGRNYGTGKFDGHFIKEFTKFIPYGQKNVGFPVDWEGA